MTDEANRAGGSTDKPGKVVAKDVAAATAMGTAMRVGASRRRLRGAGVAGAGTGGKGGGSNVLLVLLTVLATVGMLVIMIVFGK